MPEPTAVPSTPATASAPSTAATGTTTTPSAAPTSSAAPTPAQGENAGAAVKTDSAPAALPADKSVLEIVREKSKEAIAASNKPTGDEKTVDPAAPAVDPNAPVTEEAKAADGKDAKPEGEKKEDVKPADAAPEEGAIADDEVVLEDLGFVTPQSFAAKLTEIAELREVLDKHPQFKGELAHTLRKLEPALKVMSIVGSERQAKFVTGQAKTFGDIENALTGVSLAPAQEPQKDGYLKLLGIMGTLDIVRDETTGEPVKDEKGNFQRYGYADVFMQRTFIEGISAMEKEAEASQDPTLLAAVRAVKARITGSASPSDEDLTEAQKAEGQRLTEERKSLDSEKAEARLSKRREQESGIRTSLETTLARNINKFTQLAQLDDFSNNVILEKAKTAFYVKLESDRLYVQHRDYLVAQPQTTQVMAERKALAHEAMQKYLPEIVRAELKAAGKGKIASQQQAATQREQQQAASRHDVKGGAASLPGAQKTPEAKLADLETDFRKTHGRAPSMAEIVKLTAHANRPAAAR